MDAFAKYQAFLAEAGMPLHHFNPGSGEYALERQVAIEAIRALDGTDRAILGGDVVEIAAGCLRYADNWFVERKPTESEASFATRSRDYACRYIADFVALPDRTPMFVLVAGS